MSLPGLDWGSPQGGGELDLLQPPGGSTSSSSTAMALDRERMLEEIDRVMMQTHSIRGKVLNKTGQLLEKYKEEDARSTKELQELPDSLEKFEKLLVKKRMKRKIKRDAQAVLDELLNKGLGPADSAPDHALNFHLAKFNPNMQHSELPSVLEEDEDDDHLVDGSNGFFSFYAPLASDAQEASQATQGRYQPPKSRKAKKLFNSMPAAPPPPSSSLHEQGEVERRHRCRKEMFGFLERAREEEEKMQKLIEECERFVRMAPDDASRKDVAGQRSRLYRSLAISRRQAAEAVEDLFEAYQPRVPNTKEDEVLRVLEKELKLTTLQDVYKEVSSTLSILAEADAQREAELLALMPEESGDRMVFGDDDDGGDGGDYEYDDEDAMEGEEENEYEYEEYEYEEEEGGYDNDFEDEGEQQQHHQKQRQQQRQQQQQQQQQQQEKATKKGKVMVLEPRAIDRGASDAKALAKMKQDPSVMAEIQNLEVVRPVTSEGQGIERGIKGRVQDNTAPIDTQFASLEIYSRGGGEAQAPPYYMPGYAPPRAAVATSNNVGPPWLEARREVQRSQQQGGYLVGMEGGGEESKEVVGGGAVAVDGGKQADGKPSSSSPSGGGGDGNHEDARQWRRHGGDADDGGKETEEKHVGGAKGGEATATAAWRLTFTEETAAKVDADAGVREEEVDSLTGTEPICRKSLMTRGAKLGEHNVLIRVYHGESGGDVLEISAFDPKSQETYSRSLSKSEAKRLLGPHALEGDGDGDEEVSEVVVRKAGLEIVGALRLVPSSSSSSSESPEEMVLEVDLPPE